MKILLTIQIPHKRIPKSIMLNIKLQPHRDKQIPHLRSAPLPPLLPSARARGDQRQLHPLAPAQRISARAAAIELSSAVGRRKPERRRARVHDFERLLAPRDVVDERHAVVHVVVVPVVERVVLVLVLRVWIALPPFSLPKSSGFDSGTVDSIRRGSIRVRIRLSLSLGLSRRAIQLRPHAPHHAPINRLVLFIPLHPHLHILDLGR